MSFLLFLCWRLCGGKKTSSDEFYQSKAQTTASRDILQDNGCLHILNWWEIKKWGADKRGRKKIWIHIPDERQTATLISVFICDVIIIHVWQWKRLEKDKKCKKGCRWVLHYLQKCALLPVVNTDKRSFDEGRSSSELPSISQGWVNDNSWADDFPALSIIFNGLRDRQLTETDPDGFSKSNTSLTVMWIWGGIAPVTMEAT